MLGLLTANQRLDRALSDQSAARAGVTCDRPDTLQYSASCPSVDSPTRLSEALTVSLGPIFSLDKWSHTRAGEMEINLQSLTQH